MKARNTAISAAVIILNSCGVSSPARADMQPPKKEVIHTMLLRIYEAKQSEEVAQEFQALIALRPNDDKLHFRYGLYLEKVGSDRAVKEFKRAAELALDDADYWGALGNAYYRTKNYNAAGSAYKRAAECDGGGKYSKLFQFVGDFDQLPLSQRDHSNCQKQLKNSQ